MQQPQQMLMTSFPPTNITTEQIQKYLDENKKLILAILDNQNLGKLAECAQYQAQLQKNLMYLAAIADAQPQAPAMPSQMPPHPVMQQGGHYMQHPQAAVAQQPGVFPAKAPLQFNPQQLQEQQQQHQQHQLHHQHQQASIQSHMGMRLGANNGMHAMHSEATLGGGSSGGPSSTAGLSEFTRGGGGGGGGGGGVGGGSNSTMDVRGGNKQDASEAGSSDGQGNSAAGHGGGGGGGGADGEPSYLKGSDDAN